MDPRHLLQLATILEKGSITQASRHLHLTQPTLTHNMQTLEMQAGGQLFERSRLGVRSTPLGELLAREGRDIARRINDAREASARHRVGMRNQVRIAAGPLVSAAMLPGLTAYLLQRHPELAMNFLTDRPHLLIEQLVAGQHDLVIAPSWMDRPPQGIAREVLVDDRLGVFCGASHRLAPGGHLTPTDAAQERWITLGLASPFDQDVVGMLGDAGIHHPRTEITVLGDAFSLLSILAQGRHLAVLPHYPVRALRSHFPVQTLQIDARARPRRIYLWCREDLLEDNTFVRVRQSVMDHAAEHVRTVMQRAAPAPAGAKRTRRGSA
jgi:DNA-binding transcriptional LysR family regulator